MNKKNWNKKTKLHTISQLLVLKSMCKYKTLKLPSGLISLAGSTGNKLCIHWLYQKKTNVELFTIKRWRKDKILIYIKKLENDKSVDVKKKLKDPNMMGDQIQTMMEINEKLKK